MSDFGAMVLSVTLQRLAIFTGGIIAIILGYRLFSKGVYGKGGDIQAGGFGFRLIPKKGAPGIAFALFGAILIGASIWRGVEFENKTLDASGHLVAISRVAAAPPDPRGVPIPKPPTENHAALESVEVELKRIDARLRQLNLMASIAKQAVENELAQRREVVAILQKATGGKALEDKARQTLKTWVEGHLKPTPNP
jgi:hypothetical protein